MSDTVFIRELELDTVIGVYDWERGVRQRLLADVEMTFDTRSAGASDALEDALDYSAVAARLRALAADSRFLLLERLAACLADTVLGEFPVTRVRLRLCKPGAVSTARDVGVIIERGAASP